MPVYPFDMSGSGGGGYGGPIRSSSDCNIVERVPLNSPQAAVLKKLRVGHALEVEAQNKGQSLVAKYKGEVAGSLTPQALLDLLECIEKGKAYMAHVVELDGGLCEVEIRPK